MQEFEAHRVDDYAGSILNLGHVMEDFVLRRNADVDLKI